MAFQLYRPTRRRQPLHPRINWDDPINEGLIGFIWGGMGGPRDLVSQPYAWLTTEIAVTACAAGMASQKRTFGYGGYYTARNDLGQWKLSDVPLTLAVFADYVTPGVTLNLGGVMGGTGGYWVGPKYSGLRYSSASIRVGGVSRVIEAANAPTGPNVYAMSASSDRLSGYDNGKRYNEVTFSGGSAINYDATFPRLQFGGSGDSNGPLGDYYWQALWNRILTPEEHLRLAQFPYCQLEEQWFPIPMTAAPAALLGGATVTDLTSSSFRPRVNILTLPP